MPPKPKLIDPWSRSRAGYYPPHDVPKKISDTKLASSPRGKRYAAIVAFLITQREPVSDRVIGDGTSLNRTDVQNDMGRLAEMGLVTRYANPDFNRVRNASKYLWAAKRSGDAYLAAYQRTET